MNHNLFLILVLPLITIFGKYFAKLFMHLFAKKQKSGFNLERIDFKEDIYLYIGVFLLYLITFNLYSHFNPQDNSWIEFSCVILIASVPLTYAFFFHPIYYLFHLSAVDSENEVKFNQLLSFVQRESVQFRVYDSTIINAYTTGVLPFTRIILLSKRMIEKFSELEIQGVIMHELGHIVKYHLLKLYFFNILFLTVSISGFSQLLPTFKALSLDGLFVSVYFGLTAGLNLIFIGSIQKKYELQADAFAALRIGKEPYKNTLRQLNNMTDNKLESWTFSHPTLKSRLAHVDSL